MQEIKLAAKSAAAKSAAAKSAAKKLVRVQAKLIFIMTTTIVHNNPGLNYNQWEEVYTTSARVKLIKRINKTIVSGDSQSIIDHKETFVAIGEEGDTLTIISGNNFSNGELVGNEKTYKVINGVWVCTKV